MKFYVAILLVCVFTLTGCGGGGDPTIQSPTRGQYFDITGQSGPTPNFTVILADTENTDTTVTGEWIPSKPQEVNCQSSGQYFTCQMVGNNGGFGGGGFGATTYILLLTATNGDKVYTSYVSMGYGAKQQQQR